MLDNQKWLRPSEGLEIELEQCRDEGKDLGGLEREAREIPALPQGEERERRARAFYARTVQLPSPLDGEEPEDLAAIRERSPGGPSAPARLFGADLRDRVLGGWLGRACGCLLGKPVEGWFRQRIAGFARDSGNDGLQHYLRSDVPEEILARYGVTPEAARSPAFVNRTDCMPEDDDTNYTLVGLRVLERYGFGFSSADVAECWLSELPLLHLCTAERAAYVNLSNLVPPPESAKLCNPYREWIGAQIRADFYGYASIGDTELAAELAYRDAVVSHVKNGVYGEMFAAAMVSAAYLTKDACAIVAAGLSRIPEHCRLARAVRDVLNGYGRGVPYEGAVERVHRRFDEQNPHHWCHVVPNAMLVAAALLYGGMDFGKTIARAVLPGFDTDCNAATAGSIVGVAVGAARLPQEWTGPIRKGVRSGLAGCGLEDFEELADRTVKIISSRL